MTPTLQPCDSRERGEPPRRVTLTISKEAYDYLRQCVWDDNFRLVNHPAGETTACNECNGAEDDHEKSCWVGQLELDLQAARWEDEK